MGDDDGKSKILFDIFFMSWDFEIIKMMDTKEREKEKVREIEKVKERLGSRTGRS